MRGKILLSAGMAVLGALQAQAGTQNYDVKYRGAVLEDGRLIHEPRHQAYGFQVEVVSDQEGLKAESYREGKPFVTASRGENYSVRIHNPLPVRVAVNLTVDGLNSISGKPSGIADGQKWIIDPYSSVTIPGWQVSSGEARRFFFTDKPKSYAKWRGEALGKDLAANCGVIGAAYFWSQSELNRYYDDHPLYRTTQRPVPYSLGVAKRSAKCRDLASAGACLDREAPPACAYQEEAGTGMGERQSHPTTQVDFTFDRGMYRPDQAVVIYYDFAKAHRPDPFPAADYSPEMP